MSVEDNYDPPVPPLRPWRQRRDELGVDWREYPGHGWRGGYRSPFEVLERTTREIGEDEMAEIARELYDLVGRDRGRKTKSRDHYARLMAYAAERLEAFDRFPLEDAYEDGAVLRVRRRHAGTDYVYAVVRAGNLWYATGTQDSVGAVGWDDLVLWLTADNVVSVEVLKDAEVIYERE